MKGLDHYSDDPELEAELRATLRRRAADVRPNAPHWQDLLDRSSAVVVSLHTGRELDPDALGHHTRSGRRGRRGHRESDWTWLRPAMFAAACLAVVMAAGVVIGRNTHTPPAPGPPTDQAGSQNASAGEEQLLTSASEGSFNRAL